MLRPRKGLGAREAGPCLRVAAGGGEADGLAVEVLDEVRNGLRDLQLGVRALDGGGVKRVRARAVGLRVFLGGGCSRGGGAGENEVEGCWQGTESVGVE